MTIPTAATKIIKYNKVWEIERPTIVWKCKFFYAFFLSRKARFTYPSAVTFKRQPQLHNAKASRKNVGVINSNTRKKKGKGTGAPDIKKSALSSNVLTDIVSGNIELKPPKPSNEEKSPRSLSIFDQIKMGKNLKKATERELAPKPRRPISIIDEIKIGVDLKKVASSDPIDDPSKLNAD